MMTHEDMITLIGDLFIDSYIAGDRKDSNAYSNARARRDRMYEEVAELYGELESESYHREQIQVELNKANKKIEGLQRDYDHMLEIKDRLLLTNRSKEDTIRKLMQNLTDPDNPVSPLWSDYAPTEDGIPDDGHEFSEQDLPFPDVDDLAPASEVMGGDE